MVYKTRDSRHTLCTADSVALSSSSPPERERKANFAKINFLPLQRIFFQTFGQIGFQLSKIPFTKTEWLAGEKSAAVLPSFLPWEADLPGCL